MVIIREKRRLYEELTGGSDAKDQRSTIKSAAFQPQSSRFNEINRSDFIALPEQHFVSRERSSFEYFFIKTQHGPTSTNFRNTATRFDYNATG